MSEDHAIAFRNVSFAYAAEKVLDDASMTVLRGDFASVVGPNGCGKTTFLKLMLGLLEPDTGTVEVLGSKPTDARLRVGYMPQYASLDPQFPVTALDVVLMGRLRGMRGGRYRKEDRIAAQQALERVRIADQAKRSFSALSGGQRQRVLIARALCSEPELLLLDEPTANVDPGAEEAFFDILSELNKHMTILLVSHDLGVVSRVVRNVICINRGVKVHPTSELDGTRINEIYGSEVRMIRHDHRCNVEGHSHD